MKRSVILILSIFLLIGCSDDDSENMKNGSDGKINPPSWLVGKWYSNGILMFEIGKTMYMGYEITKIDVIENAKNHPLGCIIKETINDPNEYNLEIGFKGFNGEVTSFVNYHFKKISNDKICWIYLSGISEIELTRNK